MCGVLRAIECTHHLLNYYYEESVFGGGEDWPWTVLSESTESPITIQKLQQRAPSLREYVFLQK